MTRDACSGRYSRPRRAAGSGAGSRCRTRSCARRWRRPAAGSARALAPASALGGARARARRAEEPLHPRCQHQVAADLHASEDEQLGPALHTRDQLYEVHRADREGHVGLLVVRVLGHRAGAAGEPELPAVLAALGPGDPPLDQGVHVAGRLRAKLVRPAIEDLLEEQPAVGGHALGDLLVARLRNQVRELVGRDHRHVVQLLASSSSSVAGTQSSPWTRFLIPIQAKFISRSAWSSRGASGRPADHARTAIVAPVRACASGSLSLAASASTPAPMAVSTNSSVSSLDIAVRPRSAASAKVAEVSAVAYAIANRSGRSSKNWKTATRPRQSRCSGVPAPSTAVRTAS